MSMRKVPFVSGEFFHLYNRGNSKQDIFLDEEDYRRFVKLLYISNSEKNVKFRDDIVSKHIDAFEFERGEKLINIGAWVLMPNHFHLYIQSPKQGLGEEKEKGEKLNNVAKFMLKLCTSYSKYFNKKYERTGKLFEDKFKSVHIENENQAKYLFSYIHLNPIKIIQRDWKENGIRNKNEAVKFLNNYKWSSYDHYRGIKKDESKILDLDNFLNYFPDEKSFQKEIFEWLSKGGDRF